MHRDEHVGRDIEVDDPEVVVVSADVLGPPAAGDPERVDLRDPPEEIDHAAGVVEHQLDRHVASLEGAGHQARNRQYLLEPRCA